MHSGILKPTVLKNIGSFKMAAQFCWTEISARNLWMQTGLICWMKTAIWYM